MAMIKVEHFFLRYAYPCAYIKLQRGEITDEELNELEEIAIRLKPIDRQRLERVFKPAFVQIDNLASRMHMGRWDYDVIQEYFYNEHNRNIDAGKGIYAVAPEVLKDLSRVHVATVIEKRKDVLTVEYTAKGGEARKRNVFDRFVPDIKEGEKVRIHFGYAVERVA